MNIRLLSALTALVIGLPLLASAAATGTAQQAQGAQNQATQQKVSVSAGLCPKPSGTLKRGSSGADVTRLQQFLARDKSIYPEGIVNGTYGPLTEKAVQRFQVKNGIVSSGTPDTTGYGAVGPRTAAAMAVGCTGAGTTGSTSATNTLGGFVAIAPFVRGNSRAISVQVTVNAANSCNAATYTLDYGDSTGKAPIQVPAGACKAMISTVNHTYQLAGTYQVTLSSGSHKTSVAVAVI
ncbi:MAG: peptidoglycan-binding domain-containing protein [Patescibacteria group bacterium]